MALLGRLFVVLSSLLVACVAAAFVPALAMLMPRWPEFLDEDSQRVAAIVIGTWGVVISIAAVLPAMLVIALAEGFRWRSILFYAVAGGALGLIGTFGTDAFAQPGLSVHLREIMVAAGIAGGCVYWALAGRNAGRWRERRVAPTRPV